MTSRVAFLRAVNLGKRTVRNARLVELYEELEFSDVWTFINSGNVVFGGSGRRADLERRIGATIEDHVGFEETTFVRSVTDLRRARPYTGGMAATTVKVSAETRDRIRALGSGTLEDVIVEALDALEIDRFWAQADAAATWRRALGDDACIARAEREAEVDRAFDGID